MINKGNKWDSLIILFNEFIISILNLLNTKQRNLWSCVKYWGWVSWDKEKRETPIEKHKENKDSLLKGSCFTFCLG